MSQRKIEVNTKFMNILKIFVCITTPNQEYLHDLTTQDLKKKPTCLITYRYNIISVFHANASFTQKHYMIMINIGV